MQTGRSKALSMLIQTGKEAGYSHLVLENGRKKSGLPPKEENLCMFLYRGVLERKITLDYRLAPYLNPKNPPQEEAMWLLRLGLFQILYAPRIPDYVAVSQTAEAAKKAGYPRLVGLCNGVLRAFLRDGGAKSEKLPDDPVERISILGSLDKSLARLLLSQMGEEKLTAYLLRSFEKKPVWFRVNLLKISEENCYQKLEEAGFSVEKGPLFASFTTPDTAALIHHCIFTDGLVFVQDLAAQMAAAALGAEVGDLVADVCAAPGTKTVALAGMMANKGEILAGELHPHRLAKLKEAAEKMGALIIHPVCRDASLASEEEKDAWDKVLVDAPCSGLGTLAGKPEIRWKSAEQIGLLAEIQQKILYSSAKCVKINGHMVYATCTVNQNENQKLTAAFLADHPGFERAPLPDCLAFLREEERGEVFLTGEEWGTDGFYFARFVRRT